MQRGIKKLAGCKLSMLAAFVSIYSNNGVAEPAFGLRNNQHDDVLVADISNVRPRDGKEVIVDKGVYNVDASAAPEDYQVWNQAVLNVKNGAATRSITAVENSSVNIDHATVDGGVDLWWARADVISSTINNQSGIGFYATAANKESVWQGGSRADIWDSSVTGLGIGLVVGPSSIVSIAASQIRGHANSQSSDPENGQGLKVANGTVVVSEGSYVEGANQGIGVIDSLRRGPDANNLVIVDNSVIRGIEGEAIKVLTDEGDPTDIVIRNGSTLLAGNGTLLDVEGISTTRFTVDNSALVGNLIADQTSTFEVTLQNNAQLTGNIINSDSLAIKSGAGWTLAADNQVNTLDLRGGHISFGEGAFKTLTTQTLAGHGTFAMRIDLNKGEGDLLKVEGQATGNHRLNVSNTGAEVVNADAEPLLLVDTGGGDAQFSLIGRRADLGVYSYGLEQMGDDWFIVGSGKTISPSTQSVLALFNAAPGIWNSELTTLRSRMGEVRGKEQADGWIRAYGSRFNASTGDGVDYRNNQSGLSFGADAPLPVSIGQLNLGLMAGYSKNSLDLDQGTSGKIGSYYLGGYATWLLEDGYYLDGVLKLNRFRNESKVAMSDGANAKGSYSSSGVGGSLEFGRHIRFGEGYFVEPYAQLTSVWVRGDRYALDNGMQASNKRTQSVVGKLGTSLGRSITLKDGGVLQPYVRVAAAQEFSRNNQVKINTSRFDNDLSGSRAELGAGVSVKLSERLQLHADFDYMKGKSLEQPWGANVGLKLAF
jgi:outer membrane autotransporter protein